MDQAFGDFTSWKALAVECDSRFFERARLRLPLRKHFDVLGEHQSRSDPTFGVMVAVEGKNRDSGLIEPSHLREEKEPGLIVAPFAVVEVAGDNQEGNTFLDGESDQVVESVPCGRSDLLGSGFVITGESPQGAVQVDVGGMEEAERRQRTPPFRLPW